MKKQDDPHTYLKTVGTLADAEIDLAGTALALAALEQLDVAIERYVHHLEKLTDAIETTHAEALVSGQTDSAESRLASLTAVLHDQFGYIGDAENYDHIQNANLMRVIDRGKGLPIALAILYIHCGRAQGWNVDGLGLPGHFVCRIEYRSERLIFDPFDAGKILAAHQLREIVKRVAGPQAELSASFFDPVTNREILVRLQNNIKLRQIESEDYAAALQTVERMRLVDPGEYRLLLDAGVLYARTEQPQSAIEILSDYIDKAPNAHDRYEASILLEELKQSLN